MIDTFALALAHGLLALTVVLVGFVAVAAALAAVAFDRARGPVFLLFFAIFWVPDRAAISGPAKGCKRRLSRPNGGRRSVAIGAVAAIVPREFA